MKREVTLTVYYGFFNIKIKEFTIITYTDEGFRRLLKRIQIDKHQMFACTGWRIFSNFF